MLRSRFVPTLFGAGLVLAAACSDATAPSAPSKTTPGAPLQPELVTLTGSVHLTGQKLNPVSLSTSDGQDIALIGANAEMLVSLENAGVEVHGGWDADGAFTVADFLVETVGGAAVVDGILIAVYAAPIETADVIGYAIRPTRGGQTIALSEPSTDLLAYLGERIWVAGADQGVPTAFGLISKQ
jgi:hypothetical protein